MRERRRSRPPSLDARTDAACQSWPRAKRAVSASVHLRQERSLRSRATADSLRRRPKAGLPAVARGGAPAIRTRAKAGGEGGIRTPGRVSRTPVFKTGAINHSATSPLRLPPSGGLRRTSCCARSGRAQDARIRIPDPARRLQASGSICETAILSRLTVGRAARSGLRSAASQVALHERTQPPRRRRHRGPVSEWTTPNRGLLFRLSAFGPTPESIWLSFS